MCLQGSTNGLALALINLFTQRSQWQRTGLGQRRYGRWQARLADDLSPHEVRIAIMKVANPAVIPRNHLVQEALSAAERGDLAPFEALLAAIRRPDDDGPEAARFMVPPEPGQRVLQTFCGT